MSVPQVISDGSTSAESLIEFWRKHPVQAALDIFGYENPGFDLDIPQRIVVDSRWRHQYEIDVLGRGEGKTWLNARVAALAGMLYPGNRIGFIGPSFRQAKSMFAELQIAYDECPAFRESVAAGPTIGTDRCYLQFKAAPGKVGSLIEALPMGNDGAKIRGARYYWVFADELAQIDSETLDVVVGGFLATSKNPILRRNLIRDLKKKLEAGEITPEQFEEMKGTGNRFTGTSTAYYQFNHLWTRVSKLIEDIYEEKQRRIRQGLPHEQYVVKGGPLNQGQIPARYMSDGKNALCAFPYFDVSEGFLDETSIERQRNLMSSSLFGMEYCCLFPTDSEGFFRRRLLDAARRHRAFGPALAPRPGMKYAIGIDPARTHDRFAIALFEIDTILKHIRLVRVWSYHRQPFPDMHRKVREVVETFHVEWICMDAGGGGTTMMDLLANEDLCPIGQSLILCKDEESHLGLDGDLKLELVQFANYEWLKKTHEDLLSDLQHGKVLISAVPPLPDEIYVPEMDDADEEITQTLNEMATIVTSAAGNRLHWDTPTKTMRKDRYSAVIIGYYAAKAVLNDLHTGMQLAEGFVG